MYYIFRDIHIYSIYSENLYSGIYSVFGIYSYIAAGIHSDIFGIHSEIYIIYKIFRYINP